MVAILPNRAELEGEIISIRKEKKREAYHAIKLKLINVAFIKGGSLLTDLEADKEATVFIPTEIIKSQKIKKGMVIACNVRKGADLEYFVIPDSIRISRNPDTPHDD